MMTYKHAPVLYEATIKHLNIKQDGIYVDGTLGGGGHACGICDSFVSGGTLIGIDRDRDAIEAAKERLAPYACRKELIQANYADIKEILRQLNIKEIHGAVLDLGVSSFQLDQKERGFSYKQETLLDMRMDQGQTFTAEQLINTYSEKQLTEVIKKYGEEKWASRISSFIVKARETQPVKTTGQLVEIIKAAIPASARRQGPHPAKRSFQAIRIEVNDELNKLQQGIEAFCDVLAPAGRLCVITFHSLEDRIAKEIFNRRVNPCICPKELPCVCGKKADIQKITSKPITAEEKEREENPRARSAKLRVIEKKR